MASYLTLKYYNNNGKFVYHIDGGSVTRKLVLITVCSGNNNDSQSSNIETNHSGERLSINRLFKY